MALVVFITDVLRACVLLAIRKFVLGRAHVRTSAYVALRLPGVIPITFVFVLIAGCSSLESRLSMANE